jgi:hypothetical protein
MRIFEADAASCAPDYFAVAIWRSPNVVSGFLARRDAAPKITSLFVLWLLLVHTNLADLATARIDTCCRVGQCSAIC